MRTDCPHRSLHQHPPTAPLHRPPKRQQGCRDENASVISYRSIRRSHHVTEPSAPIGWGEQGKLLPACWGQGWLSTAERVAREAARSEAAGHQVQHPRQLSGTAVHQRPKIPTFWGAFCGILIMSWSGQVRQVA
jgi:hypothetical protein